MTKTYVKYDFQCKKNECFNIIESFTDKELNNDDFRNAIEESTNSYEFKKIIEEEGMSEDALVNELIEEHYHNLTYDFGGFIEKFTDDLVELKKEINDNLFEKLINKLETDYYFNDLEYEIYGNELSINETVGELDIIDSLIVIVRGIIEEFVENQSTNYKNHLSMVDGSSFVLASNIKELYRELSQYFKLDRTIFYGTK